METWLPDRHPDDFPTAAPFPTAGPRRHPGGTVRPLPGGAEARVAVGGPVLPAVRTRTMTLLRGHP